MNRPGSTQTELQKGAAPSFAPQGSQGILILRDGRPAPMIPSTASVGLIAVIAPGILLERHTFSDLEVSRHLHPTHCLHLQTAGVSRVHWFADGKSGTETMSASSLMLHGQGTWDSMAFTGESSRIVVSLDPASIANMLQDESGRLLFQTPSRWHFLDRQVERLMRNLEAEAENGFQTGRTYAQLIGLSLCEYLMRRYSGAHLSPPTCKGGLPKRRLDRVLEYIAANLSQSLSLTEIAEIAGMSPYHFARLFKTSTGLSPHQFVLAQRIERAKHLLRGGKSSVIDVALQSGFDGQSHFSKMFRKATGLSPIRFRNHLQ